MSDHPERIWLHPDAVGDMEGYWCDHCEDEDEDVEYVRAACIAELEGQVAGHQEAHARLWEQHAARVVERDGAMLDFQGRTRQLEKLEKHHEAVTAERDKLQGQLKCSIEERFSLCDKLAKLQGEREAATTKTHEGDTFVAAWSVAEAIAERDKLRELARAVVEKLQELRMLGLCAANTPASWTNYLNMFDGVPIAALAAALPKKEKT